MTRALNGLVLLAAAVATAVPPIVIYRWSGLPPGTISIAVLLVLPAVVTVLALWLLSRPPAAKLVFLFCLGAVLAGAYAAEWVVASRLITAAPGARPAAHRLSVPDVIADLRAKGVHAVPSTSPYHYIEAGMISPLPLAGVADATTVFCDEGGGMVVYESDEHGFRNPRGLWSQSPVQALLLGDSYVHGACVADGRTMADEIRKAFPLTLNLGMRGNGPLLNLAELSEYGPSLRPAHVIWVFTIDNDFQDLSREQRFPVLRSYLDGGTQKLVDRRDAAQAAIRRFVEQKVSDVLSDGPVAAARPATDGPDLGGLLTLEYLRRAFGLFFSEPDLDYAGLAEVLMVAKQEAMKWEGRLMMVYLPSSNSYFGAGRFDKTETIVRHHVAAIATELGIPFVDGKTALDEHASDTPLYYRLGSHLTPEGQQIIGNAVVEALER